MCNSSSSVLVPNRTSPSLLHTFVAYTTQLSIAIQHTGNSFLHQHIPRKTPSGVFLFVFEIGSQQRRLLSDWLILSVISLVNLLKVILRAGKIVATIFDFMTA